MKKVKEESHQIVNSKMSDGKEAFEEVKKLEKTFSKGRIDQMEEKGIVIKDNITPQGYDLKEIRMSFESYKILITEQ